MNKSKLEKEYKIILEGYKASLRVANVFGGADNSCSGQLGVLAEIRAAIDVEGALAKACQAGWDLTDYRGRRVSVKATHIYKDTRNIYISGKIVSSENKYEYLCVYFWDEKKESLELLYRGSIKKAIAGLKLTKNGKWGRYNLKMKHLKLLQEGGRDSC